MSVGMHLVWFGLRLREGVDTDVPFLEPCRPLHLQGALFEDIPSLRTFASSYIPLVSDCGSLTDPQRFVYLRNLSCPFLPYAITDFGMDEFKRFVGMFSGRQWSVLVQGPFLLTTPTSNRTCSRRLN